MSSSSIENSISIENSNSGENSENLEVKNEPEDLADHEIEEIHFDESDSPNSFNGNLFITSYNHKFSCQHC